MSVIVGTLTLHFHAPKLDSEQNELWFLYALSLKVWLPDTGGGVFTWHHFQLKTKNVFCFWPFIYMTLAFLGPKNAKWVFESDTIILSM